MSAAATSRTIRIVEQLSRHVGRDETGVLRIGGTRLDFDTIVDYHNLGWSLEQLQEGYPDTPVGHLQDALALYAEHRPDVDAYLAERERQASELERSGRERQQHHPASVRIRELLRRKRAEASA